MVRYVEIFAFSTLTKMLECHCLPTFPSKICQVLLDGEKNTHGCSHASNRSAVSSRWFITSAWELHIRCLIYHYLMILTLCWSDFENVTTKNLQICKVTKNPEDLKVSPSQCFKRFHFVAHELWVKFFSSLLTEVIKLLRMLAACCLEGTSKATGKKRCGGVKQI